MYSKISAHCSGCGVTIGQFHRPGCDWERCPICGEQSIGCEHTAEEQTAARRLMWTGRTTLEEAALEYGFYCHPQHPASRCSPYIPCDEDFPDSILDATQVLTKCIWDPNLRKFVLR